MAGLLDLFAPSNNNGLLNGIDWGDAVRRTQQESLVQSGPPVHSSEWNLGGATNFSPIDFAMALVGGPRLGPKGSILAYHGSPYNFERFDTRKIGTGEGAQAYGHGHYFSENEAVAKSYRDQLAPVAEEDVARFLAANRLNIYKTRQAAIESINTDIALGHALKPQLAEAKSIIEAGYQPPKGHMYEVNIKADPERFLNWDARLGSQSEPVKEALAKLGYNAPASRQFDTPMPAWINGIKSADAARNLQEAGIPGIKYLDQGSRGAGEGTNNYVVFNPAIVDILRKYGWMLPGAGAAFGGRDNSQ